MSPIPWEGGDGEGRVRALPPGSRCKETAVGWQEAQLAAPQGLERWRTWRGETGKWQDYQDSRDPGGGGVCISPPWPGNWLAGLAKSLSCYPGPAHPDLGRTFCCMIPS